MKKNLAIASDHNGFELKEKITKFLHSKKITFTDFGTNSLDRVDYPDYANKVVEEMIKRKTELGVLICGTGTGMSIAVNRHSEIRGALCVDVFMSRRARQHNNANILIIGAQITDEQTAIQMIEVFLNTQFEGGRHSKRLDKIN